MGRRDSAVPHDRERKSGKRKMAPDGGDYCGDRTGEKGSSLLELVVRMALVLWA
jgi:hypothetical protein